MSNLEWSTPPKSTHNQTKEFVEALKQRPGQWAKWPRTVKNHSDAGARRSKFPGTQWVCRKIDGEIWMWGRWVGTPDE